MLPRQRIASVAYAMAAGTGGIPSGGIIMWSGTEDDIPDGWVLCDGKNYTPDLRDKFIVGAGDQSEGAKYAPENEGGQDKISLAHSHSINAESPGTNAAGVHHHYIQGDLYNHIGDTKDGADDGNKDVGCENHGHRLELNTWDAGSHSHVVNAHSHNGATGSGLSTVDILPPYFALCFIMKK